jgi:N-methylhydantoinase B/oxoprolinase/acetone carboxylase alpha subunit
MIINDKQWELIVKRLDGLEQSIFDDRKNLDRMQIDIATLKEQNERILAMVNRGQEKVTEAVQNATSEAIEPIREQLDEFTDKKVINVDNKMVEGIKEKKSLWNRIRGWK